MSCDSEPPSSIVVTKKYGKKRNLKSSRPTRRESCSFSHLFSCRSTVGQPLSPFKSLQKYIGNLDFTKILPPSDASEDVFDNVPDCPLYQISALGNDPTDKKNISFRYDKNGYIKYVPKNKQKPLSKLHIGNGKNATSLQDNDEKGATGLIDGESTENHLNQPKMCPVIVVKETKSDSNVDDPVKIDIVDYNKEGDLTEPIINDESLELVMAKGLFKSVHKPPSNLVSRLSISEEIAPNVHTCRLEPENI